MDQVTVIIRSAGERTTDYCKYLISHQVPEKDIIVINETPFSVAVAKSFNVGYERALPWTLCIDADVLPASDSISKLINYAKTVDKDIFEIQGLIRDKLFKALRPAGNHLYRTQYLKKALKLIPEEGTSLRPESDMLDAMAGIGHPWMETDIIVGIHDYEQFFKDIYRKVFVQGRKFKGYIENLDGIWKKNQDVDKDYSIAIEALKLSQSYKGPIYIDINKIPKKTNNILEFLDLKEKSPLTKTDFREDIADAIIAQTSTEEHLKEFEKKLCPPFNVKLGLKKTFTNQPVWPFSPLLFLV